MATCSTEKFAIQQLGVRDVMLSPVSLYVFLLSLTLFCGSIGRGKLSVRFYGKRSLYATRAYAVASKAT